MKKSLKKEKKVEQTLLMEIGICNNDLKEVNYVEGTEKHLPKDTYKL
ncbi:MAG: hypothetical protein LBU74_07125 [Methanobacteriaceae archaeon]|nr:hypothetical protein [Candidatus Methanorudis spinitermitis]